MSPAAIETLLDLLADSLAAGVTPHSFVRSAGMRGLPVSVAETFRRDTAASVPLSSTFHALELLDPAAIALIRAKELQGAVPEALKQVAERIREQRRARTRLLLLLAYPAFLVLAAILLFPLPVLFSPSGGLLAYLTAVVPWLAVFVAVPGVAFGVLPRLSPRSRLRRALRHLAATFPLLRPVTFNSALASFADLLGSAIRAGLPMRQALSLAAECSPDPALQASAPTLVARLDAGGTLAEVLAGTPRLPDAFLARIASGEQSGTLDVALPRLVEEHRTKARTALTVTVAATAIAVAVVVLAGIALKVVGFWSSYFQGRFAGLE